MLNVARWQRLDVEGLPQRLVMAATFRGFDLQRKGRPKKGVIGVTALAKAANLDPSTVSRLKDGHLGKETEGVTASQLAKALRVSLAWLLSGEGPMLLEEEGIPLAEPWHRAWYAYHALPRGRGNRPPPKTELERAHGASRVKLLTDLITGAKKLLSADEAALLAPMLQVSADWLHIGASPPPKLSGPIEPPEDKYPLFDTKRLVSLATVEPGKIDFMALLKLDNFRKALAFWSELFTPTAIRAVVEKHDVVNNPNAHTVDEWKQILFQAVQLEANRTKRKPRARKSDDGDPAPAAHSEKRRASGHDTSHSHGGKR